MAFLPRGRAGMAATGQPRSPVISSRWSREGRHALSRAGMSLERLLLFSAFPTFFILVLVVATSTGESSSNVVLTSLAAYLLLLSLPLLWLPSNHSWTHPLIFTSMLALLTAVKRFPAYTWGLSEHQVLGYDKAELEWLLGFELFLTCLGLVAYYSLFAISRPAYVPRLRLQAPRALRSKVLLIVVACAGLASWHVWRQGGLSAHFATWEFGRHTELQGMYYFITAASLGLHASLLWWALDDNAPRSPLFWTCAAVSLFVSFVLTGSRSNLLYTCVIALIFNGLQRKKLPYARLLFAAALIVVVIGELGEFRRGALWSGDVRSESSAPARALESIASGWQEIADRSTTASGSLPVFAEVPDRVGYLYGKSYLAVLALPIPRALWAEKPGMIGGEAGRLFLGLSAGLPVGPVAEAYWNFGVVGVLLAYGLFGVFHRWLLNFYDHFSSEPPVKLMYAIVLMLFTPSSVGLVDCLLWLVPLVVLLWLFGAISFRRPHTPQLRQSRQGRSLVPATTQQG